MPPTQAGPSTPSSFRPRSEPARGVAFASGLVGRIFGGHCAATRSASSAAAVFERQFTYAATKNAYDEILTGLAKTGGGRTSASAATYQGSPQIDWLTYSMRILHKSAIRNCDVFQVTGNDVEKILDWENSATKQVEIQFKPAVSSQVFTGVPAVVHLACRRDAMCKLSSDPNKINPFVRVRRMLDTNSNIWQGQYIRLDCIRLAAK